MSFFFAFKGLCKESLSPWQNLNGDGVEGRSKGKREAQKSKCSEAFHFKILKNDYVENGILLADHLL